MKTRLLIGFLLALFFTACRSADMPPAVYVPGPANSATTGDTLVIEQTYTDDYELQHGGIYISPEFDSVPGIRPRWHFKRHFPLDGRTAFRQDTLYPADSLSRGNYRVKVFALDAGGQSDTLKYILRLSSSIDPNGPLIDTSSIPDTVSEGELLFVMLKISDDTRLAFADITLTALVNDSLILHLDSTLTTSVAELHIELDSMRKFQGIRMEGKYYDWVNNFTTQTVNIIVKEK